MRFSSSFFFLVVSMTSSIFSLNVDLLASSVIFPFCFGCLSFSFFSCYVFLNFYIGFLGGCIFYFLCSTAFEARPTTSARDRHARMQEESFLLFL